MCSGGGAVGWGTVLQATPPRTVGACPNQDGHCLTFTRYSHNANEFSQFQWLCVCGRSFLRRVDHSSRRILRSVVCLWSWSFNKRRSWPTRDCCAMRISSIFLRAPSTPMKQGTTHFPIHQPLFALLHCQVCDKFYPRMLCETFFIRRFVADRIGAYQYHRLHVTTCTSIPHPYNRKARCSAENGDISHSSYPWLLALRDLLLMNKHPTRLLRITGCGRKILFIYKFIYIFSIPEIHQSGYKLFITQL